MASKKITTYNAQVNLGGDRNQVVVKSNITAAEILILQAIHGDAEVHEIEAQPAKAAFDGTEGDLLTLLERKYGRTRTGDGSNRKPVLVKVFPAWPKVDVPADAKEARIREELMAPEKKVAVSGSAKNAAAKKEAEEAKTAEAAAKIDNFTE